MTIRQISVIVIVFLLAVAGMANAAPPQPAAQILVQTNWLAAHLKDPAIVILHVGGNKTSYDAEHIPGAQFLPLSAVAVARNGIPNQLPTVAALKAAFEQAGVSDKSQVVLYGDMIGLFAARAYFALDYLGHGRRAALLDGGLEKWKAEHRDLSTAAATPKAGNLNVKPHPELIADLAAMKQIVASKQATLIDARPPAEYSGAQASEGVPRAGHIPGAKNVFWMDNLASKYNPVLKPVAEMQAKYAAAGVKRGRKVVVYCRTGVQAAHDYFTLKLLGFSPVLYEGSFFEWSNAPGTAVETGP
ncbi:MAG: sulfurtransferase [Candidatus Korobacteraceae bacterium]